MTSMQPGRFYCQLNVLTKLAMAMKDRLGDDPQAVRARARETPSG